MSMVIGKDQKFGITFVIISVSYAILFLFNAKIGTIFIYDKALHLMLGFLVVIAALSWSKDESAYWPALIVILIVELYRSAFVDGGVAALDAELKDPNESLDFVSSFLGSLLGVFIYRGSK